LAKGKSKTPLQQSGKSKSYVVAPGDTLWSIARKNNITTQQIIAWNKLTTKTALRPGQKLTLRQDNHADTLPSKGKMLEYTVQKGDSIYGISQRHNISPQNLRRWNNINSDNQLRVGQRLVMRADASAQNEN
jgi:membrane-bound lytic murein transglycosylase D